jgi:4-amino-4-deoxy-L-arabinose transferase-like glycosyltransferase
MKPILRTPTLHRFQVHRDLAVLVLVVVGCAAPFLSQPFHMDDNFYMDMAHGARAHPLYPNDSPYDFAGYHVRDTGSHSHPPLDTYLLAAVQHFFGEGEGCEWIYHSIFLFFPVLGAWSLYFIAARFVERPLWPSLTFAVCPLVLVMEHTLMTDIPTVALWLAAVACFLYAADAGSKRLYAASAGLQVAAVLFSYQAVALAPLLGYYQIRKRGRAIGWIALLLPLAGLSAWLVMSSLHYHRLVVAGTAAYVQSLGFLSPVVLGKKALAFLEYQGWLIVFPFFLLYVFARGLKGRLFALAALVALYLAQAVVPDYRPLDEAIFVIGLVAGAFVAAHMGILAGQAFRKRNTESCEFDRITAQFLVLWYFGVAAYCLFILPEGSARYVLPLLAPVLILFFRRLEVTEVSEYRAERAPLMNSAMVASGSLVLTLAWGLFLAQADFEFARIYPRAASAFERISAGLDSYITGEWGFRYYFSRVGVKPLPADESAVHGGAFIVIPKLAMPYGMPADLHSITMPFAQLTYNVRTPFRTMDVNTPAGFYSTGWSLIPFSLSTQSLETLEIRQVNFMVERLPWARIECAGGVMPWPGLVSTGDQALAVLALPGTRITYPWTARVPVRLDLAIGFVADRSDIPADAALDFVIQARDARGNAVVGFSRTLNPGSNPKDKEWQRVRLLLPAAGTGGETLVFEVQARGKITATGAFAQSILTPQ